MKPIPRMISLCFLSAAMVGPLALTPGAAEGQTLTLLCSGMNAGGEKRQEPDFVNTIILDFEAKELWIYTPKGEKITANFNKGDHNVFINWLITDEKTKTTTKTTINRMTGGMSTISTKDNFSSSTLVSYGGCHAGDKQF